MDAYVETSKPAQKQEFAEIYERHHARVLRLCRYLLNSSDAAEDAAHEAFVRAQRKYATYDPSQPMSSWLLGIASHYCIDVLRRRGLESRIFESDDSGDRQPDSGARNPLSEMLAFERGDAVRKALSELPDRFRIPLVLAYYNELSYDEIAAALSLKRATVATLIFRGKQKMRALMSQEQRHGMS